MQEDLQNEKQKNSYLTKDLVVLLNNEMMNNVIPLTFETRYSGTIEFISDKTYEISGMSQLKTEITFTTSNNYVYFKDSFEITEVENYIRKKRKQGLKGFGIMHVLLAAYIRVVSQRPAVNRFLSGQKLYQRDDDIVVMLTIKRSMTLEAEETIVKAHFRPTDTADDVYALLNRLIMDNRPEDSGSDFDGATKVYPKRNRK